MSFPFERCVVSLGEIGFSALGSVESCRVVSDSAARFAGRNLYRYLLACLRACVLARRRTLNIQPPRDGPWVWVRVRGQGLHEPQILRHARHVGVFCSFSRNSPQLTRSSQKRISPDAPRLHFAHGCTFHLAPPSLPDCQC